MFWENPNLKVQWREKSWMANIEEIKENKHLKIKVKIWKTRIIRWIKENQAGIILYVRGKYEEVQGDSCVIVSRVGT